MNPNTFDNFRRAEPLPFFQSNVDNTTFDYYRRTEPLKTEIPVSATATVTRQFQKVSILGV
jgi:hypothetical protein